MFRFLFGGEICVVRNSCSGEFRVNFDTFVARGSEKFLAGCRGAGGGVLGQTLDKLSFNCGFATQEFYATIKIYESPL